MFRVLKETSARDVIYAPQNYVDSKEKYFGGIFSTYLNSNYLKN